MAEKQSRSWLEIRIERELNADANIPVSQEIVNHAVNLKRAELKKKRKFKQAISDREAYLLVKKIKAHLN